MVAESLQSSAASPCHHCHGRLRKLTVSFAPGLSICIAYRLEGLRGMIRSVCCQPENREAQDNRTNNERQWGLAGTPTPNRLAQKKRASERVKTLGTGIATKSSGTCKE